MRVLIVDDSPEDREFIADLLMTIFPAVDVVTCTDGNEAFDRVGSGDIDLVVLDYRLEADNGLEVLGLLRQLAPTCPVIMLTGLGSEETAVAAMAAGAADYLPKRDLTANDIERAVTHALNRAALERRLSEKNEALGRAERLSALGRFAGNIAHDFNNLLAVIRYAVDLALVGNLSDKTRNNLTTSLTAVERGAALTSRLMAFARQDAGTPTSRDVAAVLEECRALASRLVDGTDISLVIVDDAPMAGVLCDQPQLGDTLLNLVKNACDAIASAERPGRIEVSASVVADSDPVHEGFIALTVSDDGPGMTPEVLHRCTEPFFSTKQRQMGTGLGLSIAYGFVKQSGGDVRIRSAEGQGTTITLFLPPGSPSLRTAEQAPSSSVVELRVRRILLVEDDSAQLKMLRDLLAQFGYEVLTASGESDATQIVRERDDVDLLLTDIRLAELEGFDLARRLRVLRPGLPVVYISGLVDYDAADMEGVEGPILGKPCAARDLYDTIETRLAR